MAGHPDQNSVNPLLSPITRDVKALSYYCNGIADGNRFVLAEAITLIESNNRHKQELASQISSFCFPISSSKKTLRLAITGPPGAGKSTFIESFGLYLIAKGHHLAVLAIDPSSRKTGGSILGDKSRMEKLASNANAFIRPSSAGELLGGVAYGTKESIPLCEAAGYDMVLVETVGVGQSEYLASEICDITILLIQPGSGDDMQGMKKGIVEVADIFIVTKADGQQLEIAQKSKKFFQEALHLTTKRSDNKIPPVLTTSSLEKTGFDEIYNAIVDYRLYLEHNNLIAINRIHQDEKWFNYVLKEKSLLYILENNQLKKQYENIRSLLLKGNLSSHAAVIQMEDSILTFLSH